MTCPWATRWPQHLIDKCRVKHALSSSQDRVIISHLFTAPSSGWVDYKLGVIYHLHLWLLPVSNGLRLSMNTCPSADNSVLLLPKIRTKCLASDLSCVLSPNYEAHYRLGSNHSVSSTKPPKIFVFFCSDMPTKVIVCVCVVGVCHREE